MGVFKVQDIQNGFDTYINILNIPMNPNNEHTVQLL